MPSRPFYVTLVGIYLLFFGLDGAWFLYSLAREASAKDALLKLLDAAPLTVSLAVVDSLIELTCGIWVFRGANWARWLWSVMWMVMLIIHLASGLATKTPTAAVLLEAVTTILLFLPGSNAYFDPNKSTDH